MPQLASLAESSSSSSLPPFLYHSSASCRVAGLTRDGRSRWKWEKVPKVPKDLVFEAAPPAPGHPLLHGLLDGPNAPGQLELPVVAGLGATLPLQLQERGRGEGEGGRGGGGEEGETEIGKEETEMEETEKEVEEMEEGVAIKSKFQEQRKSCLSLREGKGSADGRS